MRTASDLIAILVRLAALPVVLLGLALSTVGATLIFGTSTVLRWLLGENCK